MASHATAGNHAFAREFNELVPDTWSIINDQVRIFSSAFDKRMFTLIRLCCLPRHRAWWFDTSVAALQDAVVRSGKFVIMYKRPGHRVIINATGDLIVRPSYVESSVRQRPGEQLTVTLALPLTLPCDDAAV